MSALAIVAAGMALAFGHPLQCGRYVNVDRLWHGVPILVHEWKAAECKPHDRAS